MKSYVSMEQQLCVATGKPFDTGSILMDRRLQDSFERHTITGWGISPEVQEKLSEGFICLVGIDPVQSSGSNPDQVYRTGEIVYMKKQAFTEIFSVGIPDKGITWIDHAVLNKYIFPLENSK